jgi:hypothetical protein
MHFDAFFLIYAKVSIFFFLLTLSHLSLYTQSFLVIPINNWTVKRLYFVEFNLTSSDSSRPFNWKQFLKMFSFICSIFIGFISFFLL